MTQSPDAPPLAVVIVLNWNNLPDTLECVASLTRSDYPNLSIWIVDNNSREDPTKPVQAKWPMVRVIRNPRNLGYGGGNNVGLRLAVQEGAAYVLLLNNDATVAADTVRRLVEVMEADRKIGMATPRVFYYDRPGEVYWDGGFVDWETGDTPHDSRGLPARQHITISEWLDGCALFVRTETLSRIGLLDERYFLYFEDADWTVRASRAGWTNAVVEQASAWHKVSRSTGGATNASVRFYYARNRYLFLRANRPSMGVRWKLRYVWRIIQEYVAIRREQEGREAIVTACIDLLQGRSGPYDSVPGGRHSVCVADRLLLPLANAASRIKGLVAGRGPSR